MAAWVSHCLFARSSGNWSATFKAKTGDSIQLKSKWSSIYVREGNAWKIEMDIWNITPEPAPTA